MPDAIRADVVVDTWNLRKQAGGVLGTNRFPDVRGLARGLECFGFDVQQTYAAVACNPYSDSPSKKVQAALQTTRGFADAVKRTAGWNLLEGRLTDRSGELEEKLVDVLCAVQITRSAMEIVTGLSNAQAIVVISQDIDLTPAYGMARSLGVPVYAAANETVDRRPGDWLILGDGSLKDICGRPNGDVGHERKTTLSKQLISGQQSRRYECCYFDSRNKAWVFRHRTGVEGLLPASEANSRTKPGTTADLFPVDLHPAGGGSNFPRLRLSATKPVAARPQYLLEGEVLEWIQPTRVRVKRDDGAVRAFDASPGTVLPGMKVALHHVPGSRSRLIGALDRLPVLPEWGDPMRPKLATVESSASTPGGTVRAKVSSLAGSVGLLPPSDATASVGDVFAVVPRTEETGRVTKVTAVSTSLVAAAHVVKK